MNVNGIDNQRTIRIHRHWLGPEWIRRFTSFGEGYDLPFGGSKFINGHEGFASAQSIAGAEVFHRYRLQNHERLATKRSDRWIESDVTANNAESHGCRPSDVCGAFTGSTIPTTTMRAGVVFPSFARAMSPSVETSTVEPFAAPNQSTTTIGSTAAEPSASRRCATRNRHPSRVGCLTAATEVPPTRARNMVI